MPVALCVSHAQQNLPSPESQKGSYDWGESIEQLRGQIAPIVITRLEEEDRVGAKCYCVDNPAHVPIFKWQWCILGLFHPVCSLSLFSLSGPFLIVVLPSVSTSR